MPIFQALLYQFTPCQLPRNDPDIPLPSSYAASRFFFFLMICVHVLGSLVYLFFMYLFVLYKVSFCSPGWSGTYYVPQAVLELMANLLPQSVSVPYFVTFI